MDAGNKSSNSSHPPVLTGASTGTKDVVILGIILFLFFASFVAMFGVSIYELVKKEPQTDLLFIGEEGTQLKVTSSWTTLYDFYTGNIDDDQGLRSFKGEYKVILSSSTGVNFRVIDENDNILGSSVSRGENYLESTIPFNSGGNNVSNLVLQYMSTQNSVVGRIEIEIS